MKQTIILVVIALVGAGAGVGIGISIVQPKIEQAHKTVEELTAKVEEVQAQSQQDQDKLRVATDELTKVKSDLSRSLSTLRRSNTELEQAKSELLLVKQAFERAKAKDQETPQSQTAAASREQPATAKPALQAQPARTSAGPVQEYTVQSGDSFWKIAQAQLDNGSRFQEIIDLNPEVDSTKPLKIGMKLKLPAK